jgi:multimeric flavodoxin WrbA
MRFGEVRQLLKEALEHFNNARAKVKVIIVKESE